MSRFLHSRFTSLAPYTPGEQPQDKQFIKLNTNESPFPPSPRVVQAACEQAAQLNLYSDPTNRLLTERLAKHLGVQPEEVLAGNGSDELLTFIFAAFCENGAAFADVTYGFYRVYAQLCGFSPTIIPLRDDFTLSPEDYFQLGQTILIANPNAPTGVAFTAGEIEQILKWNTNSLVVVDEAYVDFGAETAVPLTHRYDNLLVVGTFSKSRSLAGARLGYAVGNPRVIADLGRLKYSTNPYNVNRMTQAAGVAALDDAAYFEQCRKQVMATRAHALLVLRGMGFEATESLANFVFVRHPAVPGGQLYQQLRENGILVRWFNQPRINEHLRITIGTDEQMDALFAALRKLLPPSYTTD